MRSNPQFKAAFREVGATVRKWREEVGKADTGATESLSGMRGGLGVAHAALKVLMLYPTFALAASPGDRLTHSVRFGGWGLDNPLPKAVGIDRNDAAKPTQKAGEAAAHVQAVPLGERLKAVAVDVARLSNSPSTGRTHRYASFRPTHAGRRTLLRDSVPL